MSARPPGVALLASRIRVEERLLVAAYAAAGVDVVRIDERGWSLPLDGSRLPEALSGIAAVHDRNVAFGTGLHQLELLSSAGLACVNTPDVVRTAGDKLLTSIALARAGVPQPESRVAFSIEEALRVLDTEIGYPAVLKPTIGSWGRLVARLNDRHAAEAVLEDREVLGGVGHRSFYLQRLIEKPGRDLRVFVIGGEPVAGIARNSEHWVTNTARGARVCRLALDDRFGAEVAELAVRAANAVGQGILAVDLVEDPLRGVLVLEVNHGCEFRNSIEPTGVDIPGAMVSYVLRVARSRVSESAQPLQTAGGAR